MGGGRSSSEAFISLLPLCPRPLLLFLPRKAGFLLQAGHRLSPAQPLPEPLPGAWERQLFSAPATLLLHPAGVGKALSAPSFPQKPSCKATNMSRLCLSIALLVLLGTLVACTPEGEPSNQAQESVPVPAALRPAFCLEPPYTGPCRALFIRYFYNAKSGLCETFAYGGCRRKQNNFLDKEDCISTCGGRNRARDLPSSAEPCVFPHLHPTLHHHCFPWRGQRWKFWHPVPSVSGGRGLFNKETPFPHSDVEYLSVCGLNLIFNKFFS
ncbi:protein AMBP-like isoform X3 [Phocoena sinus]|uniref:protein AMBP-like isoform X3 n=1 Tax=Phocoena sinus TaxID=42100 RepID=UPI0013C4DBDF|nr:protein AMBP-like isoform X3 [Phocoena sinus]